MCANFPLCCIFCIFSAVLWQILYKCAGALVCLPLQSQCCPQTWGRQCPPLGSCIRRSAVVIRRLCPFPLSLRPALRPLCGFQRPRAYWACISQFVLSTLRRVDCSNSQGFDYGRVARFFGGGQGISVWTYNIWFQASWLDSGRDSWVLFVCFVLCGFWTEVYLRAICLLNLNLAF